MGIQCPQWRHTLRVFGVLTGVAVITLSLWVFIEHRWGSMSSFITRLWNLCACATRGIRMRRSTPQTGHRPPQPSVARRNSQRADSSIACALRAAFLAC